MEGRGVCVGNINKLGAGTVEPQKCMSFVCVLATPDFDRVSCRLHLLLLLLFYHSVIARKIKIISTYPTTKMSDHITSPAQHAAVPTEDPPAPQHGAPEHEHNYKNSAYQHVTHHQTSIHENSEKVMAAFHDQMMALAEENTPQSATEAHKIAHLLLERTELPLAIRARAHIVLSSRKTNYLHHAQEAVRIAQKGRNIFGPRSTPEAKAAVDGLLWEAEGMLRRAERDMEELTDLRARRKASTLKLKKGEKVLYGNINGASNPPPRVLNLSLSLL